MLALLLQPFLLYAMFGMGLAMCIGAAVFLCFATCALRMLVRCTTFL